MHSLLFYAHTVYISTAQWIPQVVILHIHHMMSVLIHFPMEAVFLHMVRTHSLLGKTLKKSCSITFV